MSGEAREWVLSNVELNLKEKLSERLWYPRTAQHLHKALAIHGQERACIMLTPQSSLCAWLVLWHCDLRSSPKNTWTWVMLCHFQKWLTRGSTCILHCCCCLLSHVWLWDSRDGGSSGSFIHGILQARMLDCLAISFSRGSSQPRNRTHVSCLGRWVLYPLSHRSQLWPEALASFERFLEIRPRKLHSDLLGQKLQH